MKPPLFFGCWNDPGHYLHEPGGQRVRDPVLGSGASLDGDYAPLRRRDGGVFCLAHSAHEARLGGGHSRADDGQFLRHVLPEGYTALAWWDSCQGDTRPGCNSVFLMEGEHDTPTMLAALRQHFPHVVANLERHGVALVEVKAT